MAMTYYFNGDCRSEETLLQIKKAFLGEISNYIDCSLYPDCSLENVKVWRHHTFITKSILSQSSVLFNCQVNYYLNACLYRTFANGAIGRRIDPS